MKANKVFRCVLYGIVSVLWIHAYAQSTVFPVDFSKFKGQWYDLTNDGVMEYMSKAGFEDDGFYQFNSDLTGSSLLAKFPYSEGLYCININNDNIMDAYKIGSYSFIYLANEDYTMREVFETEYNKIPSPIDFNNDGFPDFVVNEDTRQADVAVLVNGEYITTKVQLLTPEDYAGIQKELKLTGSTSAFAYEYIIVPDKVVPSLTSGIKSIDLNSDGYVDFVNPDDGSFYQSLGDRRYVKNSFGGKSTFRDFNNDGLMDVLVWDSENLKLTLFYSNPDLSWGEKKIFSNLRCNDELFCYDFDKDGDVDVLVPFDQHHNNPKHDNGASYIMVIENQGNNSFKKHEFLFDGTLWFKDCFDMDGDGLFEISALKANEADSTDLVLYEVSGLNIMDSPQTIKKSITELEDVYYLYWQREAHINEFLLADVCNSGYTNLFYTQYREVDYSYKSFYTKESVPSIAANNRPTAPQTINYSFDASTNQLKISWSEGTDKETSSVDLTYALRIGTKKDKGDIYFAHANTDGTRRNLLEGNSGYSRHRVFDVSSWKAGKYYISVQSVDPNCLGSVFSEYVVFEKHTPASDFILSYNDHIAIGDTCTVVLQHGAESGCTYHWDWAGGTVVSAKEDGSEYKIVFHEGGDKLISLHVEDSNGNVSLKKEQVLSINHAKIKVLDRNSENPGKGFDYAKLAMDLDEDGDAEIVVSDHPHEGYTFHEGDAEGNYTSIKKLWNSNMPDSRYDDSYIPTDINHDGKADLAYYAPDMAYLLINEDGELTAGDDIKEFVPKNVPDYKKCADFNNDGFVDLYYTSYQYIYANDGTYQSYKIKNVPYRPLFLDYNRDGLMDIIEEDGTKWHKNNGDFTFTESELNYELGFRSLVIADFDGDGTWDYFDPPKGGNYGLSHYADTLNFYWGDSSSITQIPCVKDEPFCDEYVVADVDNNGCLDIVIDCQGNKRIAVIYLNKDHSFKMETIENDYSDIEDFNFHTTDGRFIFNGYELSNVANEKPLAPTNLRASQNGKFVTIEWNHSVDKETPEALMQYNISIKHKGKTGEGSYLISPLNSTKNGVPVPSPHNLLIGNKFTIPLANIPAGEYEVQVQGVDRWHQESDFSEVYNLTVLAQSVIEMPTSTGIGKEVTVVIVTNSGDAVNFGEGATAVETSTGVYTVSWNTAGQKTVTVGSLASQSIYVYPLPEAGFTLPESVLEGATVNFTGANIDSGTWEYSFNGADFEPVAESEAVRMSLGDGEKASLVFNAAGEYKVRHTVSDAFNSVECTVSVIVTGTNSQPEIAIVNINPDNGKYQINWSAEVFPEEVTSINVYKETTHSNVYELLANVPVSENSYTDLTSQPDVTASRYHISYVLPYGESECSNDHQAMHVMINQGLNNTCNLSWSHYEGAEVDSYRILGGTTADNLQLIAEVSGHISSYSDIQAVGEMKYYAVEIQIGADAQPITRSSANVLSSRSNVISADDASVINFITDIVIYSETGESVMKGHPGETLQLFAYLHPFSATLRDIDWSITDGNDFATIDKNGLLTATKSGNVIVKATAVDGSEIFDEFTVVLDITVEVTGISLDKTSVELIEGESMALIAIVSPEDATDKTVTWTSSNETIATVANGVVTALTVGEVIISVQAGNKTSSCLVTVRKATGIENVVTENELWPADIYDVTGRMIRKDAISTAGLHVGLYFIKGKKVLVE